MLDKKILHGQKVGINTFISTKVPERVKLACWKPRQAPKNVSPGCSHKDALSGDIAVVGPGVGRLGPRPWLAMAHLPVTGLGFLPGSNTTGPREELVPLVT